MTEDEVVTDSPSIRTKARLWGWPGKRAREECELEAAVKFSVGVFRDLLGTSMLDH